MYGAISTGLPTAASNSSSWAPVAVCIGAQNAQRSVLGGPQYDMFTTLTPAASIRLTACSCFSWFSDQPRCRAPSTGKIV